MIKSETIVRCWNCDSEKLVKDGHDAKGKQKYQCKDCGKHGRVSPERSYTEQDKEKILNAYKERASLRGIQRVFKVARQTVAKWIKQEADKLKEEPKDPDPEDMLDIDEMWTCVRSKKYQK